MGNLGGYSCICENIAYMETGIWFSYGQWIGLGEHFTGKPHENDGKIHGFRCRFSQQNQSIDQWFSLKPSIIPQGGAPKIAKLVYNSNKYGLLYL